jgi:hypothetical protein
MGTRSITRFFDENGKGIANMYRQMDGYPSGHGKELAAFLNGGQLVNGIRHNSPVKQFNGMDCLAAMAVWHFKDGETGGIYLQAPRVVSKKDIFIEYQYHVRYCEATKGLEIKVIAYKGRPMFQGNLAEYTKWLEEDHDND